MMISHEKRRELERYSALCNDEVGEICEALIAAALRTDYALSNGFELAIEAEIDAQLENFTQNSRIIEREETRVTRYEELEWVDL